MCALNVSSNPFTLPIAQIEEMRLTWGATGADTCVRIAPLSGMWHAGAEALAPADTLGCGEVRVAASTGAVFLPPAEPASWTTDHGTAPTADISSYEWLLLVRGR